VILPGDTVLVVHFDGAFRQDSYFEYDVSGSSVILDARQICDENGVIEWAIGVSGIRDFSVDTRPLELSTVNVNVAY